MSEEILVNVTPRETRVAVVENGMLQELHIERGWRRGVVGLLGVFLNGRGIRHPDEKGRPIKDQSFYLIFNSHYEAMIFILPDERWGRRWQFMFGTHQPSPRRYWKRLKAGQALIVEARSVALLRRVDSLAQALQP